MGRDISVDNVVRDISNREKINVIEIGEKEVKQIDNTLAEKDFYEPKLPEDRKRRFKVLNLFLLQQSPLKVYLCTFDFDNHCVAPQSVFGFLIDLKHLFQTNRVIG